MYIEFIHSLYTKTVKIYYMNYEINTYIQGDSPGLFFAKLHNNRGEVLEIDQLYYYYIYNIYIILNHIIN